MLLRADGGTEQGTGHVMRCLTLAAELHRRGHDVHLMTAPTDVPWLADAIAAADVTVHCSDPHALPEAEIVALGADWVVVDSYLIDAAAITSLDRLVPVLAIVDADTRGIDAHLYLDQNLGAEHADRSPELARRTLAGARYALVREAVLTRRVDERWLLRGEPPAVLCFMGGSDPSGASVRVAAAVASIPARHVLTVVAPVLLHDRIRAAGADDIVVLPPTPRLPDLFSAADVVVSAAGTSAWDLCALGVPTVLTAVVDNQQPGLDAVRRAGLALCIDAVADRDRLADAGDAVERLLGDEELRRGLSVASRAAFDGLGAERVAARMESDPRP